MAWIRRLPSSLWAATVYTPSGRRTKSFELKGQASAWAAEQEASIHCGNWIDPRLAETTVGEWWDRCQGSRRLEAASRRRDESHWRCHVSPRWAKVSLGGILKPDVSKWVNDMESAGVGPATIHGAVNVLRTTLEAAVDAEMIRSNPCDKVKLPRIPPHIDRVITPSEEVVLLARLDELFPGRADAGLLVRVMLGTGGRWEEVAAVHRPAVDLRRRRVWFGPVVEADGTIRGYAKTPSGDGRWVGLDDDLTARLREHVLTVAPEGLVFTGPRGGVLLHDNWRRRIWGKALLVRHEVQPARPTGRRGPMPVRWRHYLDDPQPTPHDCRHTFGSRLADAGVPEHEIAELMGHADRRSTQRYIHAGEQRFDRQRSALARARNSQITHDLDRRSSTAPPEIFQQGR